VIVTTRRLQSEQAGFVRRTAGETNVYPPAFLEYAWYASLAYGMLGQVWGIVIPSVGGGVLVLLAAICLLNVGDQALRAYKPIAWALWTGIFVITIQFFFHTTEERAWAESMYFLGWLGLLIIAQTLSLRPKFLQRFALVAFAIGLACLPYINIKSVGGVMRAWASGTGISNPNVLGLWFGFSTVYFLFWGLQCRKPFLRAAAWVAAIGSLYIVTLSVSRGPLLAIVLACVVGFRSELKRSFVPLLSLVLLMSLVYVSGVFDEEIAYYTARGAEESGRGKLWPLALERILDSPWVGVGLGDILIRTPSGKLMNPHNGLLHIALGAGIVPVIFFLAYLGYVAVGAVRMMRSVQVGEVALLPPLIAFGLFETMVLDFAFMTSWVVVVFGLAASASHNMISKERLLPGAT
jgi:O-antigen ligase